MTSVGASKLSLSSLTTVALWNKTGRSGGSEFFRLQDRKGTKMLLAPTHEEEITQLVGDTVNSYKQLPLRVYQIGRKYRDERRPRAGMLRGREFSMKDLYTFDIDEASALRSYEDVQAAYKALFDELRVPYLVAEADSGSMGGSLSHEYLYPSESGEDTIVRCGNGECGYTANVEAALPQMPEVGTIQPVREEVGVHQAVSKDRKTLINTFYLKATPTTTGEMVKNEVNLSRIKDLVPELDTTTTDALALFEKHFTPLDVEREVSTEVEHDPKNPPVFSRVINIFDAAIPSHLTEASFSNHAEILPQAMMDKHIPTTSISRHPKNGEPLRLLHLRENDACPRCQTGKMSSETAVEVAHTFHLGTRYTEPMGVRIPNADNQKVTIQEGCHGIGVSRLVAAIAESMRDEAGLDWPRVVAPWEVAVLCHPEQTKVEEAEELYKVLREKGGVDAVLDDRGHKLMWKMKDAVLVGYPVFLVLGRSWERERKVEVQCKRLGVKEEVEVERVLEVVQGLLAKL